MCIYVYICMYAYMLYIYIYIYNIYISIYMYVYIYTFISQTCCDGVTEYCNVAIGFGAVTRSIAVWRAAY